MKIKTYNLLPEFGTNTYLVWDEKSKEAVLFDVAAPSQKLANEIRELGLNLKYLFLTHGHGDHIAGIEMIKNEFTVELGIHELDAEMLTNAQQNLSTYWNQNVVAPQADLYFKDGDKFQVGELEIKVIHTPGHTKGGVCFLIANILISGDTLFAESIGRTDLPGGDYQILLNSIKEKLFTLPGNTVVYPGHGPETTIEDEKVGNPFVGILT